MRIDAHGHACGVYVTTAHVQKKLDENMQRILGL
jgi:hypothetical protein